MWMCLSFVAQVLYVLVLLVSIQFGLLSPALVVRRPVANICSSRLLIISVEFRLYGSSNIRWCSSNFIEHAAVCTGTTPHP
jgi:hypothetical protein